MLGREPESHAMRRPTELPSTMGTALRHLVRFAEGRGVDVQRLIDDSPLDRAMLDDPLVRLPAAAADALFDRILRAGGDPLLHLRMAPEVPIGAFQVIDFVASSADTLGEGYRSLARYFCIVHQAVGFSVEEAEGEHRFVYRPGALGGDGAFSMAMSATRFVALAGPAATPRRAELIRAPIDDPALARRLFGDHVVYGAPRDMLVFDDAQWALPQPGRNPMLQAVLQQHARSLHADLAVPETLADRVAAELRRLLGQGRAELRHAARRLAMSPRTLQRRLRADGTSFQALLDATRRDLAAHYLADEALTVLDVAFMLGYADESAFHRAFRRWHARSPGEWRRDR